MLKVCAALLITSSSIPDDAKQNASKKNFHLLPVSDPYAVK